MPTISAGALKRMLHLPANVVVSTPRVEDDPRDGTVVIVPVRPHADDMDRCARCGGHGRPYDRLGVRLLGEVAGMVDSLLSTDEYLEPTDDARKQLKDSAGAVLDLAIAALEGVSEADWKTDTLHETLNKALVEDGGYKPRLAFGPVRVAMSGRRVSPPLFESMEIVGRDLTIARLKGLRAHL